MNPTEANKQFIRSMLSEKKQLEDYPERFDPDLIMHEPAILPFGGTYQGLAQFKQFYPKVRRFYDFERFELLGVYADGDMVFATIKLGLTDSPHALFIAEQFRFSGMRLVEVRVHVCDPPGALQAKSGREDVH